MDKSFSTAVSVKFVGGVSISLILSVEDDERDTKVCVAPR